jgi:hypothetical protein
MSAATTLDSSSSPSKQPSQISWKDFLEARQPSPNPVQVLGTIQGLHPALVKIEPPLLELYCSETVCEASPKVFQPTFTSIALTKEWSNSTLNYRCRNCQSSQKHFFIRARNYSFGTVCEAIKIAEWPPFGPPLSARVVSLVGHDRELFLQGRRSEIYGYGIGAMAYYRRVVENQKNILIREFRKAAQRLGAPTDLLKSLEEAERETQFSTAIDMIKPGIPPHLLIVGQNPLALLHKAASIGLHNETDEECLKAAEAVRTVLTEMADRIGTVLKDQSEIEDAVKQLQKATASAGQPKGAERQPEPPA